MDAARDWDGTSGLDNDDDDDSDNDDSVKT
jgi:hypothetical protein